MNSFQLTVELLSVTFRPSFLLPFIVMSREYAAPAVASSVRYRDPRDLSPRREAPLTTERDRNYGRSPPPYETGRASSAGYRSVPPPPPDRSYDRDRATAYEPREYVRPVVYERAERSPPATAYVREREFREVPVREYPREAAPAREYYAREPRERGEYVREVPVATYRDDRERRPVPSREYARADGAAAGAASDGEKDRQHAARQNREIDTTKVYVAQLPYDVGNDEVYAMAKPYCTLPFDCRVVTEHGTNRSRGFAFVNCQSEADATAVRDALNGRDMGGRLLSAVFATKPPPGHEPRRSRNYNGPGGGGGAGGGGGYQQRQQQQQQQYTPREDSQPPRTEEAHVPAGDEQNSALPTPDY